MSTGELIEATVEHTSEATPMALIQAAVEGGCDTEKLRELMALQREWDEMQREKEKRYAEVAFSRALAACEAEMQPVVATRRNVHTGSQYADLGDIEDAIRPIYTTHGFSVSAFPGKSEFDRHVRVHLIIRHEAGHKEQYADDFPLDDVGSKGSTNKTAIQAKASTITYGRRYLLMGFFNLSVIGEDRDGNRVLPTIGDTEIETLNKLLEKLPPDDTALADLLKWAEIESLDQLPMAKYESACRAVRSRLGKITKATQG